MYSAVCQCVFLIACAFVGLSTAVGVQGGASEMRTSLAQRLQPFQVISHYDYDVLPFVFSRPDINALVDWA